MTVQHEIGRFGESLAAEFLIQKGFEIIELNWRYRRAEIDIIAKDDHVLVFVEVKTRSSDFFGPPEDFVSKKKINFISQAASAYMETVQHSWIIRFDIISIIIRDSEIPVIKHIEDAFFNGIN